MRQLALIAPAFDHSPYSTLSWVYQKTLMLLRLGLKVARKYQKTPRERRSRMSKTDTHRSICEDFKAALNRNQRPCLIEFLKKTSPDRSEALLRELLPIEIKFRKRNCEYPVPSEYEALGDVAVSIASSMLETQESNSSDKATMTMLPTENAPAKPDDDDFQFDASVDTPPAQIGPYKLIQKIGAGGMGTVWYCLQEKPVRRKVALKLISSEANREGLIARFEAERQAIAIMEHQNIARIFDAGTTEDGNPYFAMEMINGAKLSRYCDERKLSTRERIRLMIPVCQAVQHAHQKGIIHRDLKHSNVLVSTQSDGQAIPKIIDFGLAKALEKDNLLTEKTLNSEFGKIVGTIQYMSPEQASLEELDVDTRTDIYSLGVMIYKLLTATTPIRNRTLESNSAIQVLDMIRHTDPELPSQRLKNHSKLKKLSNLRSTTPDQLVREVEGDLDWILAKALATDRDERYETANGLALELQRYLDHQPILAHPPTAAYKFKKFFKRNKSLVAGIGTIFVLLVAGIMGTSLGFQWALQERERANLKTIEAENLLKESIASERKAIESEARRRDQQILAESSLKAIRIKTAWSDWQLGNTDSAWHMLNEIPATDSTWEKRFLQTMFSSSTQTLYGNAASVETIARSPDGKQMASGGMDRLVKIWDTKSLTTCHSMPTKDTVVDVAFSHDSNLLACADLSNRITIIDPHSGSPLNVFGPFETDALSVKFCDNNTIVASFASRNSELVMRVREYDPPTDAVIRIIDIDKNKVVSKTVAHTNDINRIAVSPDAKTIVSASEDDSIWIWKCDEHRELSVIRKIDGHRRGVNGLAISPGGQTFVSCGNDMMARLWNIADGKELVSFVGHQDHVLDVSFSEDGMKVLSGSRDRTAKVWNLDGTNIRTCHGHYDNVSGVAHGPQQGQFISASQDQTLKIWDTTLSPGLMTCKAHKNVIWQADITGDTVVSVSEDGTVAFTNLKTGSPVRRNAKLPGAVLSVACSPVSESIIVGGAFDGLYVLDKLDSEFRHIRGHSDYIWDVCFSPDGKTAITASADRTALIWNTSNWSVIQELAGHDGELGSGRYSPDGTLIATGSDDKHIRVWNAQTFELIHELEAHSMGVWRVIFSPDGKRLASSSSDGKIGIWDVQSMEQINLINAHSDQIAGLCFNDDGSRIFSASDDQTLRIWEVGTGIEQFSFHDKKNSPIVHVSFSRTGNHLVSGNGEGLLTIRTAAALTEQQKPVLPQDAIAFTVDTFENIVALTRDDAERKSLIARTKKWMDHYPSFEIFAIAGIAHFRSREYEMAQKYLEEAMRLEKFAYGEPDLRPVIDAFLAMTYFKNGQAENANEMRQEFESKAQTERWKRDTACIELLQEVAEAFCDTTIGAQTLD